MMYYKSFFLCLIIASLFYMQTNGAEGPPWKPEYKIKAGETQRLTPADVVGPDGLVYPDWRYAGVPGGIPEIAVVANLSEFGAIPDDDLDDTLAFRKGVQAVVDRGGGALLVGAGTYYLDAPVVITSDNVVIRGQGMDSTKIIFRYMPDGVTFFHPAPGATIGTGSWIEAHAAPNGGINKFILTSEGKTIRDVPSGCLRHENYVLRTNGDAVKAAVGSGTHTLKAAVEWKNGSTAETTIDVYVDPDYEVPEGQWRYPMHDKASIGAFLFVGDKQSGKVWSLARDAKRGDLEVELDQPADFPPGSALLFYAPLTARWNQLTGNKSSVTDFRRYHFRAEAVDGIRVTLNQPARIKFPVIDGSTVQRIYPIRRCGVEGMTIEQTVKLWSPVVLFLNAWECWAQDVKIIKAGRYPVYTRYAKWCEIRDCVFDDAWYHGGGGTAYVGWERSYDCLMDNVTTYRMRHAPCLEWAAAGNVIRSSTFHNSDAQWHAGWANENLFEQCWVEAHGNTGTYGYGAYSTLPTDSSHGPIGPRNVVYNCDFRSPKAGLTMGGSNENWLILHNRFVVDSGYGIVVRKNSFDHIIMNNTIALKSSDKSLVYTQYNNAVGLEIINNRLYGGNGRTVSGEAKPLVDRGNKFYPYNASPPRPQTTTPSIFEWQRKGKPAVDKYK